MSRLSEPFKSLERGSGFRLTESISLRTHFLLLLSLLFVLGMDAGVKLYVGVRLHRFDPWQLPGFLVFSLIAFSYARAICQRLERSYPPKPQAF